MAVTTATLNMCRSVIPTTGEIILTFSWSATGDASGGTVTYSDATLASYFPQNFVAWLIDGHTRHNAASTVILNCGVTPYQWETSGYGSTNIFNSAIGYNSTNQIVSSSAGVAYYWNKNFTCLLPYYLGHPTSSTITVAMAADTNTDTKSYLWCLKFLVKPIS